MTRKKVRHYIFLYPNGIFLKFNAVSLSMEAWNYFRSKAVSCFSSNYVLCFLKLWPGPWWLWRRQTSFRDQLSAVKYGILVISSSARNVQSWSRSSMMLSSSTAGLPSWMELGLVLSDTISPESWWDVWGYLEMKSKHLFQTSWTTFAIEGMWWGGGSEALKFDFQFCCTSYGSNGLYQRYAELHLGEGDAAWKVTKEVAVTVLVAPTTTTLWVDWPSGGLELE